MGAMPDREIEERAFPFVRLNERPPKPRTLGITGIRGPYYTTLGRRALEDVLETMGEWVDALKFAGGSFTLMPRHTARDDRGVSPVALWGRVVTYQSEDSGDDHRSQRST